MYLKGLGEQKVPCPELQPRLAWAVLAQRQATLQEDAWAGRGHGRWQWPVCGPPPSPTPSSRRQPHAQGSLGHSSFPTEGPQGSQGEGSGLYSWKPGPWPRTRSRPQASLFSEGLALLPMALLAPNNRSPRGPTAPNHSNRAAGWAVWPLGTSLFLTGSLASSSVNGEHGWGQGLPQRERGPGPLGQQRKPGKAPTVQGQSLLEKHLGTFLMLCPTWWHPGLLPGVLPKPGWSAHPAGAAGMGAGCREAAFAHACPGLH